MYTQQIEAGAIADFVLLVVWPEWLNIGELIRCFGPILVSINATNQGFA
ncbi:MAG: hypothetical protein ACTS2F_00370 [Thainema sp.]